MKAIKVTGTVVMLTMWLPLGAATADPVGTAFTYQGQLKQGGAPVNDTCDFEFGLWNDSTNTGPAGQVGDTLVLDGVGGNPPPVTVSNGLFTVELDFGASAFDGHARWLEVSVACPGGAGMFTTLAPRQKLTPAPYAAQTRGLFVDDAGNVGIGTTAPGARLDVAGDRIQLSDRDNASYTAFATGTSSQAWLSLVAQTPTPSQREWHISNEGLLGGALTFTDAAAGARRMVIDADGSVGIGTNNPDFPLHVVGDGSFTVHGINTSTTQGKAVAGIASAATGFAYGVYGQTNSTNGTGVLGLANADSGNNYAVRGKTNSPAGFAGYFEGGRNYFQGNVGIGTTSPNSALEVDGRVHSTSGGFKFPDGTTQSTAAGVSTPSWSLTGNGGTDTNVNFLGTTDNVALELHVDGQRALRMEPNAASPNLIGGYSGNAVSPDVLGATISGGGSSPWTNRVTDHYGTIGGGGNNMAGSDDEITNTASFATVGGGRGNRAEAAYATIAGGGSRAGYYCDIGPDAGQVCGRCRSFPFSSCTNDDDCVGFDHCRPDDSRCTFPGVCGPFTPGNRVADAYGTVGGGTLNAAGTTDGVTTNAQFATVSGGRSNIAGASCAAIGGGGENTVFDDYGTVGGGSSNIAGSDDDDTSTGSNAGVGGGHGNEAHGRCSTIPGGYFNKAWGSYSFAAGYLANANHAGAFVWADSTGAGFASERDNQFRVGADGGARFDVNNDVWIDIRYKVTGIMPQIFKVIDTSTGAYLTAGGTWTNASDAHEKRNLVPVDPQETLDRLANMPISTWNHKAEDPSVRHIGPTAQDFHAAFGMGGDDKAIATIDADGVALVAIQGLYEIVQEKDSRIAAQEDEIADLRAHLECIEAMVAKLTDTRKGGAR